MLRKRRRGDGHDFDLSDSDDGGEARRRLKRQKFAKMQKALFADERIGKIAENPRNAAFLKSIEDTNDDEEWDFGERFVGTTSTSDNDSQSQNATQGDQAIPDSQPPAAGRKRSRMDDHAPRPGPGERRSEDDARPSSIAEVRRSLSALLEEPNASVGSVIPATEIGSDDEDDPKRPSSWRSNQEHCQPSHRTGSAVVDRITLKRNSSSISMSSTGNSGRLAFTAPSTAGSGFRVPALLRRATTNSKNLVSNSTTTASAGMSSSISQNSATSTPGSLNKAAGFGDDGKLKKSAGKRSGINYFAHENERRAKVADAEKRREAKKWKGAEGRSQVVSGLFGSGSFE
jgi:mediator of replication checkpoint protein 1